MSGLSVLDGGERRPDCVGRCRAGCGGTSRTVWTWECPIRSFTVSGPRRGPGARRRGRVRPSRRHRCGNVTGAVISRQPVGQGVDSTTALQRAAHSPQPLRRRLPPSCVEGTPRSRGGGFSHSPAGTRVRSGRRLWSHRLLTQSVAARGCGQSSRVAMALQKMAETPCWGVQGVPRHKLMLRYRGPGWVRTGLGRGLPHLVASTLQDRSHPCRFLQRFSISPILGVRYREDAEMTNTIKKLIAALAIATIATVGTVTPADAAGAKSTRIGDGWCC